MDNLELLSEIKSLLKPMAEDISELKERMTNVEKEIHETNLIIENVVYKRLDALKEGQDIMKDRLWHLPEEVEEIKESVSILKFVQQQMAKKE